MKFYWCVNCGYHGDFKFYRSKNIKCEICEYSELTELDEKEYQEWSKDWKAKQDKDSFYKSKGKINKFNQPVGEVKLIGKEKGNSGKN